MDGNVYLSSMSNIVLHWHNNTWSKTTKLHIRCLTVCDRLDLWQGTTSLKLHFLASQNTKYRKHCNEAKLQESMTRSIRTRLPWMNICILEAFLHVKPYKLQLELGLHENRHRERVDGCCGVSGTQSCAWFYTRVVECWCGRALLLWLGTGVPEGAGTGG